MRFSCLFLVFPILLCLSGQAKADCTVLYDMKTQKNILREGICDQRYSTVSTFKIPLALMGYDARILQNEHLPSLPYKPSYNATAEASRHETDPTYWLAESVVWYSQELTKKMGMEKFKHYVEMFQYGNQDLSGKDALTHAWLSSTLKISPDEQIDFLRKMTTHEYNISPYAYDMTHAIMPSFPVENGWTVYGKTGSGSDFGWFVGWAEKKGHTVLFARYQADKKKEHPIMGRYIRANMLKELPSILPKN